VTPKTLRKSLASITLLTPWLIWKQRNDCVFNGAQPSVNNVIANIKDEATLWARARAPGLRVFLPLTWDVH
jgi:nuclear pore complex protein Nup210